MEYWRLASIIYIESVNSKSCFSLFVWVFIHLVSKTPDNSENV